MTSKLSEEQSGQKNAPEARIDVVDEDGNPGDSAVLNAVAYDPYSQHLDLSKDEKRRTTALMLAIQANKNLLIPDAAYLTVAADLARRGEGPKIHPATIDGVVESAIKFDLFISGTLSNSAEQSDEAA